MKYGRSYIKHGTFYFEIYEIIVSGIIEVFISKINEIIIFCFYQIIIEFFEIGTEINEN